MSVISSCQEGFCGERCQERDVNTSLKEPQKVVGGLVWIYFFTFVIHRNLRCYELWLWWPCHGHGKFVSLQCATFYDKDIQRLKTMKIETFTGLNFYKCSNMLPYMPENVGLLSDILYPVGPLLVPPVRPDVLFCGAMFGRKCWTCLSLSLPLRLAHLLWRVHDSQLYRPIVKSGQYDSLVNLYHCGSMNFEALSGNKLFHKVDKIAASFMYANSYFIVKSSSNRMLPNNVNEVTILCTIYYASAQPS